MSRDENGLGLVSSIVNFFQRNTAAESDYVSFTDLNPDTEFKTLFKRVRDHLLIQKGKSTAPKLSSVAKKIIQTKCKLLEGCITLLQDEMHRRNSNLQELTKKYDDAKKSGLLKPDGWCARTSTTDSLIAEVISYVEKQNAQRKPQASAGANVTTPLMYR